MKKPKLTEIKEKLAPGLAVVRQYEKELAERMSDPTKRRAWELAQTGEDLFWKKQYDQGIQGLVMAAEPDPVYLPKVEAYRKLKLVQLRKGPVNLTCSVNRILFPKLISLGFHHMIEEDGPKWKDGTMQVRINSRGHEGIVYMGRTKSGKEFGLNVSRRCADVTWQHLDLSTMGLGAEARQFLNQGRGRCSS